jgi:hypothetical protein
MIPAVRSNATKCSCTKPTAYAFSRGPKLTLGVTPGGKAPQCSSPQAAQRTRICRYSVTTLFGSGISTCWRRSFSAAHFLSPSEDGGLLELRLVFQHVEQLQDKRVLLRMAHAVQFGLGRALQFHAVSIKENRGSE